MGVIRCQNGHFYDNTKFKQCPHCDMQSSYQKNAGFANVDVSGRSKEVHFAEVTFQPTAAPSPVPAPAAAQPSEDDELLTVGILQKQEVSAAVGWTVILNGNRSGQDFTLHAGVNPVTDFCQLPEERAVKIIYDPKGNQYLLDVQAIGMDIRLNGEKITEKVTPISGKSTLSCGKTEYLIVPLCDGEFQWEDD